jgi:hypothetical protein
MESDDRYLLSAETAIFESSAKTSFDAVVRVVRDFKNRTVLIPPLA